MRLTIVPIDKVIVLDGVPMFNIDMSWIPEFTGNSGISTSVHAVQWYDTWGEIELTNTDHNIHITELGVFEKAVSLHTEEKSRIDEIRRKAEEKRELDLKAELSLDDILDSLIAEKDNSTYSTILTIEDSTLMKVLNVDTNG
jgi:hypothetical protein